MQSVENFTMKRSSSKLITRARSVRNMGKVPFKFKFDIIIETVDKIAASGDVVVVLDRGAKADCTQPAKIDKNLRKASFGNDKITAEITMFKSAPSDRRFQDKVFKVCVKLGAVDGKTLGKIHLNFAEYAQVPSGSKRISAELNNGAILIASIVSTFQGMGKAIPADKPGSKADSTAEDDDDGADSSSKSEDESAQPTGDDPSNFMKNKLAQKLTRGASIKTIGRRNKNSEAASGSSASAAETAEKLRKENTRLRKQIEELEQQNASGGRNASSKLSEENHALRNETRDLKAALSREPAYADVVRELKEAKMALALVHLEKEEYALQVQKYQRGELQSPTSISR